MKDWKSHSQSINCTDAKYMSSSFGATIRALQFHLLGGVYFYIIDNPLIQNKLMKQHVCRTFILT
jgi:hypothetical protein